jgi:hypothetical protein
LSSNVCKLRQVFVFLISGQLKFYERFVTEIDIFLFAFEFLKFKSRELLISETLNFTFYRGSAQRKLWRRGGGLPPQTGDPDVIWTRSHKQRRNPSDPILRPDHTCLTTANPSTPRRQAHRGSPARHDAEEHAVALSTTKGDSPPLPKSTSCSRTQKIQSNS